MARRPRPFPRRGPRGTRGTEGRGRRAAGREDVTLHAASETRSAGKRRNARDRRGRGLRGPLAPTTVPVSRTRRQRFDDMVLDAVERLERRWRAEMAGVELAVEEVPPADLEQWSVDPVPLARLLPAVGSLPARIVVFRRPIEARIDDDSELAALVHAVVVEEVAGLLGLDPSVVDPGYDDDLDD